MSDSQAHAPADERAPSSPKMTTSTIMLTIVLISSLLQIVPFPGFFLMLLLAAFWPIVLVNLAMVFIFFEVRVKEQPKFMTLMPIIYFGGYLIAVFLGHYYQNKVKLRNMFDKSVDFVRSSDTIYISDLAGFDPVEFLRHYQTTVVIVSGSYNIDDRREPKIYETMDKPACDVADIANVEIACRSAGHTETVYQYQQQAKHNQNLPFLWDSMRANLTQE